MIQATINGKMTHTIAGNIINGTDYEWDILHVQGNNFHIIKDNISYNATVVNINHEEKTMVIAINGTDYEVSIKDKYDLLLQQMGITATSSAQVNKFKAPMPGLIREIIATEGASVQKGDILLILEAMKMENALKSPRDGQIKKIHAITGNAVEKGQVLIEFE
jgi:biotin carboxyl carrier protein